MLVILNSLVRFTRLNLRADRNGGFIRGTGQDCIGESLIEGRYGILMSSFHEEEKSPRVILLLRFDPARDRIAWTQVSCQPLSTIFM